MVNAYIYIFIFILQIHAFVQAIIEENNKPAPTVAQKTFKF